MLMRTVPAAVSTVPLASADSVLTTHVLSGPLRIGSGGPKEHPERVQSFEPLPPLAPSVSVLPSHPVTANTLGAPSGVGAGGTARLPPPPKFRLPHARSRSELP